MAIFTKPKNLNGSELRKELRNSGVEISDEISSVVLSGNDLTLEIAKADETKAAAVVAAHNGTQIAPEPTIADKLASVGLSIADLKAALA